MVLDGYWMATRLAVSELGSGLCRRPPSRPFRLRGVTRQSDANLCLRMFRVAAPFIISPSSCLKGLDSLDSLDSPDQPCSFCSRLCSITARLQQVERPVVSRPQTLLAAERLPPLVPCLSSSPVVVRKMSPAAVSACGKDFFHHHPPPSRQHLSSLSGAAQIDYKPGLGID